MTSAFVDCNARVAAGKSSTNDDEELEDLFPCVSDKELKELSSVIVDDDAQFITG